MYLPKAGDRKVSLPKYLGETGRRHRLSVKFSKQLVNGLSKVFLYDNVHLVLAGSIQGLEGGYTPEADFLVENGMFVCMKMTIFY